MTLARLREIAGRGFLQRSVTEILGCIVSSSESNLRHAGTQASARMPTRLAALSDLSIILHYVSDELPRNGLDFGVLADTICVNEDNLAMNGYADIGELRYMDVRRAFPQEKAQH